MSKFRKPTTKTTGLKVLVMGDTGVGKTQFALSFPKIYALDSETGMAFYEDEADNLLGIANTQDFNDLVEAIDEIEEIVEEDENAVKTLAIDSESKIFQNLSDTVLQVEERKASKAGRDVMDSAVSMRGWGRIKAVAQRLQNLKIDLSAKGVHIISVAQIEDVKKKVGDNFVKVGEKPVMQKNSNYDYDLIIKLFIEKDAKGDFHYKGEILKDRTKITKVGQVLENPSYLVWKDYIENRKGKKIESTLSKDAEKVTKRLEQEDAELEKTTTDKLKELIAKSDKHKAKASELIKESKIKNPLAPKDAKELKVIEGIVATLEKL